MIRPALSLLAHLAIAFALYGAVAWVHRLCPVESGNLATVDWRFSETGVDAQPVELPHFWIRETTEARSGVYTADFQVDASPSVPWSLYIRGLASRAEVSVNGIRISGAFDSSERHRFQPALVPILPELLLPGENRIELQLHESPPGSGFLDRSFVGPTAELQPAFAFRQTIKLWFPMVLAVAGFVIGALVLMLYLSRPNADFFLWYAIACFTGAFYVSAFSFVGPVLPAPWWDSLVVLNVCWFGIAVGVVGMGYAGMSTPGFGPSQLRVGAAALIAIGLATLLFPDSWIHGFVLPAALGADLLGAVVFLSVFIFRRYRGRGVPVPFWMMQIGVLLVVISIHDNLMLMGFKLPWLTPQDGLYFPFPAVPTLVTCTILLVRRYLLALHEAEALSRDLAGRVAVREAQIERSYRELQRADRERVVAAERERLFADMHDGLGGTLMTALARADNRGEGRSQAATAIRDALADLRLMLSSLDPGEHALAYELATLRERLAPLCADTSVALTFDLLQLPDDLALTPARTLSLMRIVQEACTNVLRHAQATRMRVSAEQDAQGLRILVEDDGRGFDPDQAIAAGHHGLSNIRRRAQALNGTVTWTPLHPGTRVELRLAVERPGAS